MRIGDTSTLLAPQGTSVGEDRGMNVEDVERRVAEIGREKDDFERAHGMQDDLYRDVLQAIANDDTLTPRTLAGAALRVESIDFGRYTA